MKPVLFLQICFLFIFSASFGQAPKTNQELASAYQEYFSLNRESVFLHLNKNVLVPKEELWFAAYVFDTRIFKPNMETTNLLIDIFGSSGEHIETQTLFINAGKGTGHLKLDPKKYKEGTYFIRASTSYMENFREDLGYIGHFKILGAHQEKPEQQESAFELHILPEGGHLLLNQENLVGVKLIDNHGNGVSFKEGRVVDQDNNLVTSFKSNRFGMGKFNFTPTPGTSYFLQIADAPERAVKKKLPAAELRGMNLVSTLVEDKLILLIRTNPESLAEIQKNTYTLAIHQEGKMKQFQFDFPKDKTTAPMSIPSDSLYAGVNILTVFDEELRPILERQIFNYDLQKINVNASLLKNHGDSLEIALRTKTDSLAPNSMSVSVLPAATESVHASHNILSAFYLKPYLKGDIQDAHYYFSDEIEQRRRAYDLDLLLLTQGWSKYSWNSIFNHPPKEYKQPQKGFTLRGQVTGKDNLEGENLVVLSENSGLFQILEIKDNNSFEANNLFMIDSSSVSIGLTKGRKNRITKPKISAQIEVNRKKPILEKEHLKILGKTNPVFEENNLEDFIAQEESLDTVNLEGSSKTDQEVREMLDPSGRTDYIDEITRKRHLFLTQYLRAQGFKIVRNIGGNELYIINKRFGQSFSTNSFTKLKREPVQPIVILNGTRLKDNAILDQMMMDEVNSVYINKVGAGELGILHLGGVIKITTKTGKDRHNAVSEETTYNLVAENGYAPIKEYYAPKYKSYTNSLFEKYGTIQWADDIYLDKDGFGSLKILNTMQQEIRLFIEGMTANGDLISEEILLDAVQ